MATKTIFICDRCEKEAESLETVSVRYPVPGSSTCVPLDVCGDCLALFREAFAVFSGDETPKRNDKSQLQWCAALRSIAYTPESLEGCRKIAHDVLYKSRDDMAMQKQFARDLQA